MWIMNLVWPLTGLWAGPLALAAYYRVGRLSSQKARQRAKVRGEDPPGKRKPFWQSAALGTLHCGSGCTLGDILAEWLLFFFPVMISKINTPKLYTSDFMENWPSIAYSGDI